MKRLTEEPSAIFNGGRWPVYPGSFEYHTDTGVHVMPAWLYGRWAIHADDETGKWVVSHGASGMRVPLGSWRQVLQAFDFAADLEDAYDWAKVQRGPDLGTVVGAPDEAAANAIRAQMLERGWKLPAKRDDGPRGRAVAVN